MGTRPRQQRYPRMISSCAFSAGFGALIFASTALAEKDFNQLANMSLEELVEIDVFTAANLLPTQSSKAPGTVHSFTSADFRRYGVRRVEDLLQYVPGIQLNQYRKRHQSIWARGIVERYNDKFVLLVDGIRQQNLYYGHFALGDNVPIEQIEKVEIILGPASSLYGASAFSGLISITTKAFATDPAFTTSLELGNHDRQKITSLFNSQRLQGFMSYLDQEAPFADDRRSFIGGTTMQPEDEDYQSVYLKAQLAPGLTAKLDYQQSEVPFLFIPASQNAFIDNERWSASLSYAHGDLENGRLEANAYYQQEDILEFEQIQYNQQRGYQEYQNATMAGASLTGFKNWGQHTAAVGASWRYEESENTTYTRWYRFDRGLYQLPEQGNLLSQPNIINEDYAVFVQDVWSVNDALNITLGLRYDEFEQFDSYINYRLAINYSTNPLHNWKLMYGTAIRTPTLREYLKALENTSFVAPIPDAESIESLELGYYLNTDQLRASLTFYHNTLKDFIHEMPTPNGADEYFANTDQRVRMYGAEGLLNYWVTDRWSVRLAAAYVDSDYHSYNELPYVANWSGSLTSNYQLTNDHELTLAFVYSSKRVDLNPYTEDDSNAFVLTNLYLQGRLSSTINYRLGIDNLMDEHIHDPAADFGNQYNSEKSRRQLWLELTWAPSL